MRKFKFQKPMVESAEAPQDKNVLWVDIDEKTGKLASIKEFNAGKWADIIAGGGDGSDVNAWVIDASNA